MKNFVKVEVKEARLVGAWDIEVDTDLSEAEYKRIIRKLLFQYPNKVKK